MQQQDYIDHIIEASAEEFKISDDYNEKLMMKLNDEKSVVNKIKDSYFNRKRIAALSLIVSGVFMITVNITNLNSIVYNINGKVKTQVLGVEYKYNYTVENIKNNFGGWH